MEIISMKQGTYVSTASEITRDVQQGSILGPILFLLFINDIPLNIMGSKIVLFTDDANILVSGEDLNTLHCKLNNVLKELQTWFTLNNLVGNVETDVGNIFPYHTEKKMSVLPHVIFEGRDIPYNAETKFMGVHIDENMKWDNHIKYLSSKLNINYYMISSLKSVISPYVLRTMYFACFHVHLRYGLTLIGW
jgi:hypothetical protein